MLGARIERRPLRARDDLRHRECLAGAGDAKQHLVALERLDPLHQFRDGARLVAARLIFRHQLEFDAALGFSRPFGTMRGPGLLVPDIRVAEPQKLIETVDRGLHAAAFTHVLGGASRGFVAKPIFFDVRRVEPRDRARVVNRLRRLSETGGGLDQSGVEQRGEMRLQRRKLRLRGLGPRRADGGFLRG